MKKYTKILVLLLCAFICTFYIAPHASNSASAADIVNLSTETLKGKFYTVSEGLIVLDQKGVKKSFVRIDNQNDLYRDYIVYLTAPFIGHAESTPCKVVFLDTWVVKIKLPNANIIEIPRYRVKDLEININK